MDTRSGQAVFSRIARDYDRFNAVSSLGIHRYWLNSLVRDVTLRAPRRVLDVAGGTGAVSMAMARSLPRAEITLSDLCPEMLAVAEERLECDKDTKRTVPLDTKRTVPFVSSRRPPAIRTVVADAQDLPFPDASYDAITCAYGIRNVPDRPQALAEFCRVLKPGGSLHILEFSTPVTRSWRRLYHLYLGLVVPTVGGLLTGRRDEFEYLRESIRAFPPQQAFCEMLDAAGFSNIRYRNLTGGIVAIHSAVADR
jgi:demethylmenaquinone methyltransferase/2-methoxy-6-polyprenyl-1,4-benzoquinol methylase